MNAVPRLLLVVVAGWLLAGCAPRMLLARSNEPYPETMANLQNAIRHHGYRVTRVQRVDYGLEKRGFESDKYRVVFYGKPEEIKSLSQRYPELLPFLPLKITIYQTTDHVELVAINPRRLADLYPAPELATTFSHWEKDLVRILDDTAHTQ